MEGHKVPKEFVDNAATILIVDDDEHVLKAAKTLLQQEGYITIACGNAYDAIKSFTASGCDVVLSDIRMPGVTGIELMDKIHGLEPGVPVVLFTGYADIEAAISAVKKDAFDFIIKPYDPDVLVKSIGKAVMFQKCVRFERDYKEMLEEEVLEKTKELRKTVEELRVARDLAMEASRLKSQVLANMSHELRTPLNGIIGLTDLLLNRKPEPEARKYLEMMSECVLALSTLLNNIMEMSDLDSGRAVIDETTFNLCDVISDITFKYLGKVNEKGLEFIPAMDEDVPLLIKGGVWRLRQVLFLLLDNAIKFTEKGRVKLAVSIKETYEDTVILLFSVVDTGIGIPEEKIPFIFESFRQADSSFTRQHGGVGLGLAIAGRLAGIMGGDIEVQSSVGEGSIFNFTAKFKIVNC
jgi:signal transduction histidine kinase